MSPRRAARVDDNQGEIVSALRKVGARVQSLAAVGGGVPDLLVGFRGNIYLMEVKDGAKPPSAQKLTEAQERWHWEWQGMVHIVRSVDDAIAIITA